MLFGRHLGFEGWHQVGSGEEEGPGVGQQADGSLVALHQPPVHLLQKSQWFTHVIRVITLVTIMVMVMVKL